MADHELELTRHPSSYDIAPIAKILKLDKKYSTISLADSKGSQRLTVKNNSQNAIMPWSSNPNEQNLRNFWRHINQYYFKKIEATDLDRIDYLLSLFKVPLKDPETRYSDPTAYETFKALVTSEYKNLHQDIKCDKDNVRNLQKRYFLSTLLSPLIKKTLKQKTLDEKTLSEKFKLQVQKTRGLSALFAKESETLDSLVESVTEKKKSGKKGKGGGDEEDEITHQLKKLQQEYEELNMDNSKRLGKLKKKSVSENWNFPVTCDELNANGIESLCTMAEESLPSKVELMKMIDSIDRQQKYMRKLLIELENWQAAESIKSVIDYGKDPSDGEAKYLVQFDEAIYQREVWVDESVLDHLDQLREESLFKISQISHKTKRSLSSGNIEAFQYINERIQKKHQPLKEKSWKALLKRKINISSAGKSSRNTSLLELKEFSLCHHCRSLFPNSQMLSCRYKSSTMGLPELNPAFLDPFAHNRFGNQAPKRSIYGSKRNVFSFYTRKKNGELCCLRKFCRNCLKKNYEQTYSEVKNRDDWKCPFCQGSCYCSRCMRNDRINRIASFYQLIGGNVDEIKKDSLFEKLIYSNLPDCNEHSPSKSLYYPKQSLRATSQGRNNSTTQRKELQLEKSKQGKGKKTKSLLCIQDPNKMEEEKINAKTKNSTSYRSSSSQQNRQEPISQLDFNREGKDLNNTLLAKYKVLKALAQKTTGRKQGEVKRKRGRPRKYPIENGQGELEEENQSIPAEVKSKRGRPTKNPTKGKRGRPRKYPIENNPAVLKPEQLEIESLSRNSKGRASSPALIKKVKKSLRATSSSSGSRTASRSVSAKAKSSTNSLKRTRNASTSRSHSARKTQQTLATKSKKIQSSLIENLSPKKGKSIKLLAKSRPPNKRSKHNV